MASEARKIKEYRHLILKNSDNLGSKKATMELLFLFFIIFSPYLELLFWTQESFIHFLISTMIFLYLIIKSFPIKTEITIQIFFPVAFGSFFLILATINLLNGQPVHRTTWSIGLIAAFFLSSLRNIQLGDNFFWSYLKNLKLALKITLVLHVLIFILSRETFSKLIALEVNPIPIFALSVALAFLTRDRLLAFLAILAVMSNFTFNPQYSHIFILVAPLILFLFVQLNLRISFSIVCAAVLSFFFANTSLFEFLLLRVASSLSVDNVVIRQNMLSRAQEVISQNPVVGGHLSEPLNLTLTRGSYTSILPFHSDVLTFLVAGGGIGLFLFLVNCLITFYRVPVSLPQKILIKSSNIALVCYLMLSLFNPVFPGYALLLCLTLSFQCSALLSFSQKKSSEFNQAHSNRRGS